MGEEHTNIPLDAKKDAMPKLVLERRNNGQDGLEELRVQHNLYLMALLGREHLIALDKTIGDYNYLRPKLEQSLRLYRYSKSDQPSRALLQESIQESIVHNLGVLFDFLQLLEFAFLDLHASVKRDVRFVDSIWERLWFFFRGANYVKKAHHTITKMQRVVSEEMQSLAELALYFIELHPNLTIQEFYVMHKILYKSKHKSWNKYLTVPYGFGDIPCENSYFLGRQTKRELFYRVVMFDERIAQILSGIVLSTTTASEAPLEQIKLTEGMLLQELNWNVQKLGSLSSFWQRSTKALLGKRHAANTAQYQSVCDKKVAWFVMFCPQRRLSNAELTWLCEGASANVSQNMQVIHKVVQSKAYYSKQTEMVLEKAVDFIIGYLQLLSPAQYKKSIIQKYRADALYYQKKDILHFLTQSRSWQSENTARSIAILDDMLNVAAQPPAIRISSYLKLAEELTVEMVLSGTNHLVPMRRLCQLLTEKSNVLQKDKERLDCLIKVMDFFHRRSKPTQPLFSQFAQLLQSNPDTYKVLLVINRYYVSAAKILGKAENTTESQRQRKILSGVVYRALVLVPIETQKKIASLPMIKHLAKYHTPLQELLYPQQTTLSAQSVRCFKPTATVSIPTESVPLVSLDS